MLEEVSLTFSSGNFAKSFLANLCGKREVDVIKQDLRTLTWKWQFLSWNANQEGFHLTKKIDLLPAPNAKCANTTSPWEINNAF